MTANQSDITRIDTVLVAHGADIANTRQQLAVHEEGCTARHAVLNEKIDRIETATKNQGRLIGRGIAVLMLIVMLTTHIKSSLVYEIMEELITRFLLK